MDQNSRPWEFHRQGLNGQKTGTQVLLPKTFQEFDSHKLVTYIYDKESGLEGFIVIHRGSYALPSFGATRFWYYNSQEEALEDALRLSRMMSYKAALAGLQYGGAKGVILNPSNFLTAEKRERILTSYAKQVNYLNGRFITGSDVGISQEDVQKMKEVSPFIVGVQCDPTKFTAIGLFESIKVCLTHTFGDDSAKGRSFAIQGLGKIGGELLKMLYEQGATIFVSDIDEQLTRGFKEKFPNIQIVPSAEIHKVPVDCFCPCALSNAINTRTAEEFDCKIIAGGANNQLANREMGEMLHKNSILYAPDYVINAGGLISVVDEYEQKNHDEQRVLKRIDTIPQMLEKILVEAKNLNQPPSEIADKMAEKVFNGY